MPEVTDLMRVAQWAKSSGSPSDVYNAACRLLDRPDEAELLRDEVRTLQGDLEEFGEAQKAWLRFRRERDALKAAVAEVRRLCDMTIAASCRVHAIDQAVDTLAVLNRALPAPETTKKAAEDHRDGRTPQNLGSTEGQESAEAHGAAQ